MQVGLSLSTLLCAAQSQSKLLGHIPKVGGSPVFKCYLTNNLQLIPHLVHTLKTSFKQLCLFFLPPEPIWQDLWETYADLRREAQSVHDTKKQSRQMEKHASQIAV
jgi:hypothetical protein